MAGSRITFRSTQTGHWASGVTDRNGYYELGTTEKGEGVPPGEYRVTVVEDPGDWDTPSAPTIHPKYASPKTSGLTFSVTAAEEQSYDLKLDPPESR